MVGNNLLKIKAFIPLMPLMAKKIRITNAVLLLSTAVPTWLVSEALTPQIVQAYTNRVDLEITRFPGDNYQSLLRRAEAVARAAAQRSFDKDILVTDVSVVVSAQNFGAIAPSKIPSNEKSTGKTTPDKLPSMCWCNNILITPKPWNCFKSESNTTTMNSSGNGGRSS